MVFSFYTSYLPGRKHLFQKPPTGLIVAAHWPTLSHHRLSNREGELELTYPDPILGTFPDLPGLAYSRKRL